MSEPIKGGSVTHEIVSAISSLRTEVTYEGKFRDENGELVFIEDAEPMVAHSILHANDALDKLQHLRKELGNLHIQVLREVKTDDILFDKFYMMFRKVFKLI